MAKTIITSTFSRLSRRAEDKEKRGLEPDPMPGNYELRIIDIVLFPSSICGVDRSLRDELPYS